MASNDTTETSGVVVLEKFVNPLTPLGAIPRTRRQKSPYYTSTKKSFQEDTHPRASQGTMLWPKHHLLKHSSCPGYMVPLQPADSKAAFGEPIHRTVQKKQKETRATEQEAGTSCTALDQNNVGKELDVRHRQWGIYSDSDVVPALLSRGFVDLKEYRLQEGGTNNTMANCNGSLIMMAPTKGGYQNRSKSRR